MTGRLFTSESVTEGHPDKIADRISDTVLDYLMAEDADKANLRVAVETLLTTGLVVVAGEVRTTAYAPVADIVRKSCDLLVVNDVSGGAVFGSPDNEAVILGADGAAVDVPHGSKSALAHVIWDEVARRLQE